MVTTRSADKRVDGRDEDLVLRSRTIISPTSQDLTPSRTRKRATNNDDGATPSTKRSRKIVSMELKSTKSNLSTEPQNAVHDDDAKIVTVPQLDTTEGASPSAQVAIDTHTADSESTPRQREVFRTPATSRHKRFDSVDPEDTITLNRELSPNLAKGYETAEEVIADSEESDEAPEMSSTKIQSVQSQTTDASSVRRKGRARASDFFSQAKENTKKSDGTVRTEEAPQVSDSTLEADAQVQQELEDSINATLDEADLSKTVSSTSDMAFTSDGAVRAERKTYPVLDKIPEEQEAVPSSEVIRSSERTDIDSERMTNEIVQESRPGSTSAVAQTLTTFPEVSYSQEQISKVPSQLSLRPKYSIDSKRQHFRQASPQGYNLNFRLPEPNRSSRSRLVRQRLQSRGPALQTIWPTKRSAFVTS